MFGLLDDMEDPRQAGQMAMIMGLLEAGGPSTQPIGLGQAFARAAGAGQRAMAGAKDRQLESQLAQMRMRQMQGQLAEQDATLAEKQKVADFWSKLPQFMRTPEQGALAAGAAEGDIGPTNTNAARIPHMPPARLDTNALNMAMLNSGVPALAETGMKGMAKERPKVKDWQKVNVGGQVLYAPYFEDGTVGQPVPYEVAEKLEFRDMGGTVGALNPFTGAQVTSAKKTQSPDSLASNQLGWANYGLSKQRLAHDKSEAASGGKAPAGYRWKADGNLEAIPGGPGDKLPEAQQKQVVGAQNLSKAISEYRDELKNFGLGAGMNPNKRALMGTKYNNMMLQAKEAYNLGVLNGPDYEILTSIVTDPVSAKGLITSNSALDKQASELDRIIQSTAATASNTRPRGAAQPSFPGVKFLGFE